MGDFRIHRILINSEKTARIWLHVTVYISLINRGETGKEGRFIVSHAR
jgi:hypothetical protein